MGHLVSVEVYALKKVRVRFEKSGFSKYISHLDLNRCISRSIFKSKLPVWYTEGFNSHPFIEFALSLPLGVSGMNEFFDIKLIDESIDLKYVKNKLNEFLPNGIRVIDVGIPIMETSDITFALIKFRFISSVFILKVLKFIFQMENIEVCKKTKTKNIIFNLKDYIYYQDIKCVDDFITLSLILPVGNNFNVNPFLVLDTIKKHLNIDIHSDVIRTNLYNFNMKPFS